MSRAREKLIPSPRACSARDAPAPQQGIMVGGPPSAQTVDTLSIYPQIQAAQNLAKLEAKRTERVSVMPRIAPDKIIA